MYIPEENKEIQLMKVGNVNEVKIFLLQLRNLQNVNVKQMPIK